MKLVPPFSFMLESALNRVLRQDDDVDRKLQALCGKLVRVRVEGVGMDIDLSFALDGVSLSGEETSEPDAVISGPPFSLLHQAFNSRDRSRVLEGDIKISGDLQLGQKVQRLLGQLDIDLEAMLAEVTGDVVARQLGDGARSLLSLLGNAAGHFARDSADYATHEKRDLIAPAEMHEFVTAVDLLRQDCDRLAKHIAMLEAARHGSD